ncbi:MAG: patatin-like phospholipase family protein [Candidatus Omnitrophica bacterium]|nr:patatin-like phospholipase family protein [Candidatus Omnitrophota bacterium]
MTSPVSIINKFFIIRQIPAFSSLNWLELHQIASRCTFREYSKGAIIYEKGDSPDGFYCLVSGRVCAYNLSDSGEKKNVEYIYRGTYFGIISLLTGEPHSLTFETLNDALVLRIEKDDFHDILSKVPRLAVDFSYTLSRRLKKQQHHQKSIFESTIISTYSPRQGTGGSIYAFNLAHHLKKETGKKVIFIDMNCVLSSGSYEKKASRLSPLWKNQPINLNEVIDHYENTESSIIKSDQSADLLSVCFDSKDSVVSTKISQFVSSLANEYHFIVLDLPSQSDNDVLTTLNQSDDIHLILGDSKADLISGKLFLRKLEHSGLGESKKQKIKIFVRQTDNKKRVPYEKINQILEQDIYAYLSEIFEDDNTETISLDMFQVLMPDMSTKFSQQMRKIAREIGDVRVGLVLGGGAALGISHIGVLRVIEKEGIPVDIVVGSSIGALIAGLWALGRDAQEIEKLAREFESRIRCLHLLDIIFPKSGFIGGYMIKRWLRKKIGKQTFYNTRIPLKIVAYDLTKREDLIIDGGDVVDAIRKSIAIPGVISPVIEGDHVIIDGGIVNPLPTNVLASMGIRKIIAVNILKSPQDVLKDYQISKEKEEKKRPSFALALPFYFLQRCIAKAWTKLLTPNICDIIVSSFQSVDYVLAEQSAQQADVLIHPDLTGIDWFELYKVDELIRSGEVATQNKINDIKQVVSQ